MLDIIADSYKPADVYQIGTVVSMKPLSVQVRDIVYTGGRVYLDHRLLKHKEKATFKHEGVKYEVEITYDDALKVGDKVFCFQFNKKQSLYVSSKITNGGGA